ncbi:LacI family DNA-binding transcriptional regulator [Lentibacillus saliphilus]|uniref:LacI family DNA-binding transcriptional regulator n=1 Tax=Lentibacillus saliphilus TaxID=2737028 RepID=UPI001C3058C3|nr:LacI family DNA-binding transcriptional regulator [Lentibacillus saliphilus]
MTTIRDVAKLADVSVATVSRVLNQTGNVSPKTLQRVEAAISQLNYQPNDVARSLFKGRSKMIALFVPDIMNPFFPELARAAEDVASKHGYTFVLCNTDGDGEKELTYLKALKQKSVDGIIIVSSTLSKDAMAHLDLPIIALDRKIGTNIAAVTVNNRKAAQQAVTHLQEVGCKRIAHIRGPQGASNAEDRMAGYIDIVGQTDWFNPSFICEGDYTADHAYKAALDLLQQHPEIDGIFAANDLMGVGVLKAAAALGKKVPDELAVIGFDGIALGEVTIPTLSTMAQPTYDIGARAAEMLIEHIDTYDLNRFVEPVEYEVKLIKRQSTERRTNDDK